MTDSVYPAYFNDTHQMARATARRFIAQEVKPHIAEWEEAGTFPRELYQKAGELGLLGIGHRKLVSWACWASVTHNAWAAPVKKMSSSRWRSAKS